MCFRCRFLSLWLPPIAAAAAVFVYRSQHFQSAGADWRSPTSRSLLTWTVWQKNVLCKKCWSEERKVGREEKLSQPPKKKKDLRHRSSTNGATVAIIRSPVFFSRHIFLFPTTVHLWLIYFKTTLAIPHVLHLYRKCSIFELHSQASFSYRWECVHVCTVPGIQALSDIDDLVITRSDSADEQKRNRKKKDIRHWKTI